MLLSSLLIEITNDFLNKENKKESISRSNKRVVEKNMRRKMIINMTIEYNNSTIAR